GFLFLSGFYTPDVDDLMEIASPLGLKLEKQSERNQWAALVLRNS
ncbi:MAG TPA: 50S ribosomal protein L11 methyltransferase, partial [Algoriphagus sp.]|nr:50S ribosomal protein L11 methyltransferase [Algoriphagus sp.]